MAAALTDSFLDFTASHDNSLRSIGLTGGCKSCLYTGRWKETLEAAKDNKNLKPDVVPEIHLPATLKWALSIVNMEDLKAHAAESEAAGAG